MEGENGGRGEGDLGGRASSSSERIVSGVRRSSLGLVAAVVVGFLAVGVVLTGDGGDGGDSAGDGGDGSRGAEMEVTEAAEVSQAYAEAAVRLGRARTFAFRGTASSAEASIVRPGPWIAGQLTVEGAVHLPLSITTEVAVGAGGDAVETVTSGPATWARQAPDAAALAGAPWAAVGERQGPHRGRQPSGPPSSRLGLALLVDAVQAAGDRRPAPRDEAGRQVIRATCPSA